MPIAVASGAARLAAAGVLGVDAAAARLEEVMRHRSVSHRRRRAGYADAPFPSPG